MANECNVLAITDGWGAELEVWITKKGLVALTATYWGNNYVLLSTSEVREIRDFLTAKLEGDDGE